MLDIETANDHEDDINEDEDDGMWAGKLETGSRDPDHPRNDAFVVNHGYYS